MDVSALETIERFLNGRDSGVEPWESGYFADHKKRYEADFNLLSSLAPTGPILEVGSAPGHMTALMMLNGLNVKGVDLAPERISAIIKAFDLDIQACNIELSPLPFPDNTFEYIVFNEVFEHLRIDLPFTLCQLNRVLVPGGTLLLTTPNVYSLPSIARFMTGRSIADPVSEFAKLRGMGHMGHVREYSAPEVCRCLAASGFVAKSIDYRSHQDKRGKKKALLSFAYRIVPARFQREIVILAQKQANIQKLEPIIHMSPQQL